MVLEAHIQLCVTEPDFLEKSPSGKNDQNWSKMAQKHKKITSLVLSGIYVK